MKSITCFALIATVIFTSCNKKDTSVPNVTYRQSYYINSHINDNVTDIFGSITASDNDYKKVSVNDGTIISLNGLKFAPSKSDRKEFVGTSFLGLVGADFILYKSNGEVIKNNLLPNDVPMAKIPVDFPAKISKSKGFTFEWEGSDLVQENETLRISISSDVDTVDLPYKVYTGRFFERKVTFSPTDLSKIHSKNASIFIQRYGSAKDLPNKDNGQDANVTFSSTAYKQFEMVD